MPSIVAQTLSTPVVQSVTVTLDADEVYQIVSALDSYGYPYLSNQMRALLDVPPATPEAWLATGAVDDDLRKGKKIAAIKALRAEFPSLGLKEAKDAVDAYDEVAGLYATGL